MVIRLPDYTCDIEDKDDRANNGRVSRVKINKTISEESSHKAHIVHGGHLRNTIHQCDKVMFIKIDVEGFGWFVRK